MRIPAPAGPMEADSCRLCRSNGFLFLLFFALIFALKWQTLTQPPVWDGSMSVFPAAITLAENNFDLGHLLDQPGYEDGGPNGHGISLITWLTAVVVALLGGGVAFLPVLHLIHFAIAAAAAVGIYRFACLVVTPRTAFLSSVAALLCPLVLTQAGYLYLEFPLLAATVFALLAWARGWLFWAAAWAAVAVLTKQSGVIVGAALVLATLTTPTNSDRPWARWRLSALVAGPALFVTMVIAVNSTPGEPGSYVLFLLNTSFFLTGVPDLLILFGLFFLSTLLSLRKRVRAYPETRKAEFGIVALVGSFLCFFLALPFLSTAPVLPRYYVQIVPFMLIALFSATEKRFGDRITGIVVVLVMGFFVLNSNGRFYADNTLNNFAMLERSGAYVGLLELQQEGIRVLENLETDEPVFYAQPEHYKFSYPLMGYSTGPLKTGRAIGLQEPYKSGRLEDFPDNFYMLYEFPWLGGEIIRRVRGQAEADPSRQVEVTPIVVGNFRSELLHVTRYP